MKPGFCVSRVAFALVMAVLLTGCLFRKSPVTVRHFILSPITTNEPQTAATEHLSVGIGVVKMPSYLLRDSLAVRNGDNEIQYLEGAQWGERLDQSFQRTVAANLSRLLSSDRVYSTDWARNQVLLRVFINVQQFEVDTKGHGTLVAHWRITAADTDKLLKHGTARLNRAGDSPKGNPGAIAVTLSELTFEFSRDVAQAIRENAKER
ncbi:MAG TPA: PqiC family protein [Patescibacteria group bacterium]|nr:PqiC family protein [Patescibacteria group bacterium]